MIAYYFIIFQPCNTIHVTLPLLRNLVVSGKENPNAICLPHALIISSSPITYYFHSNMHHIAFCLLPSFI